MHVTEQRRQRSALGCSLLLIAPLLLLGAGLLASTSNDSKTTTDVVWSFVLLVGAALAFAAGVVLWAHHR